MQNLNKEFVMIEVSGGKILNGSFVDSSNDIIVLYAKSQFVYVPKDHIHSLEIDYDNENNIEQPSHIPTFISQVNDVDLNLANLLSLAKGMHVEIMVTKNIALHGVITAVNDDYFVFESPIYKTMFIAIKHLKWIIPYFKDELPYGLNKQEFLNLSSNKNQPYKNTFASQISEFTNQLVILNLGKDFSQIGRITSVKGQILELLDGKSNIVFFNLSHIQIVQLV